jgi:hypothetical protein
MTDIASPMPPLGHEPAADRRRAGGVLATIGTLFLLAQIVDSALLGRSILLVLGLILYGWGLVRRNPGGLIPGGILLGLGAGVLLQTMGLGGTALGGGIFMLSFAAGWIAITVGTALVTDETMWWPLVPAAIMALVGLTAMGLPLAGASISRNRMSGGPYRLGGGVRRIADGTRHRGRSRWGSSERCGLSENRWCAGNARPRIDARSSGGRRDELIGLALDRDQRS